MSKDIQQLLQECLEGYDAGLTPEECLAAYPEARAQLEPLLRQALSLRVAYAASPSAEFRLQLREKLLFAAGRDVRQVFQAEPDPDFVRTARQRLLNRAGATAQEALRDVPPPRLPFWVNARRHLIETASKAPPKPAPRFNPVMRTAMSAAVVVLAVAIAGAGFFMQDSPANEPPTRSALSAELDYISNQLQTIERLHASGQTVSSSVLDDLAERTNQLAEQYSTSNPDAELIEKLPDLIQRQQELTLAAPADESVAAAQARLAAADERLASAANGGQTEPVATPEIPAITTIEPDPLEEPDFDPTPAEEIAGIPDVTLVDPDDLEPNQLVIQYDPNETVLDLRWFHVTTSNVTFVMPESWTIRNLDVNDEGLAVLPAPYIIIETDIGTELIVSTENGEVHTIIDGQQYTLRSEGADGAIIDAALLAEIIGPDQEWASLYYMLASITPESTTSP